MSLPIAHNLMQIGGLICGPTDMGKLTARKVETAKPGKYGDGGGLQLAVAPTGAKKWVLRFLWQGNAREMGLGSFPEVTLAEAREKALAGRRLARSGVDPIAERRKDRRHPDFWRTRRRNRRTIGRGLPQREAQGAVAHDADRLRRAVARQARRQDRDGRRTGRPATNLAGEARDCIPPPRPHRA